MGISSIGFYESCICRNSGKARYEQLTSSARPVGAGISTHAFVLQPLPRWDCYICNRSEIQDVIDLSREYLKQLESSSQDDDDDEEDEDDDDDNDDDKKKQEGECKKRKAKRTSISWFCVAIYFTLPTSNILYSLSACVLLVWLRLVEDLLKKEEHLRQLLFEAESIISEEAMTKLEAEVRDEIRSEKQIQGSQLNDAVCSIVRG